MQSSPQLLFGNACALEGVRFTWNSKDLLVLKEEWGSEYKYHYRGIWGCPKIRNSVLGVPIIRIIVFLGVYIGVPPFWETAMYEDCIHAPLSTSKKNRE